MPSGFFVKWNELILKFHMEIHRAQNIYNSLKKSWLKGSDLLSGTLIKVAKSEDR